MHTVQTHPDNASTFLTHLFGQGLDDDRYVVERFQSMADGDIRPLRTGRLRPRASPRRRGRSCPDKRSGRCGPRGTRAGVTPLSWTVYGCRPQP